MGDCFCEVLLQPQIPVAYGIDENLKNKYTSERFKFHNGGYQVTESNSTLKVMDGSFRDAKDEGRQLLLLLKPKETSEDSTCHLLSYLFNPNEV
jgi:hypothetical protein